MWWRRLAGGVAGWKEVVVIGRAVVVEVRLSGGGEQQVDRAANRVDRDVVGREEERRARWMGLWWCALLATGEDQRGGVESFTTRVKRRRRGARAKQREHHVRKRPFSELLFEGFCS
jgi:hypothetical protein